MAKRQKKRFKLGYKAHTTLFYIQERKLKAIKLNKGVPVVAQQVKNPTRNHEVVGSIPGLAQCVKGLVLP